MGIPAEHGSIKNKIAGPSQTNSFYILLSAMLIQILVGISIICASIIIEAICVTLAIERLQQLGRWLVTGKQFPKYVMAIVSTTLLVLVVLAVTAWMWAITLFYLNIFITFEESLYFTIVAFTTLGLGDLVITSEWRLISGFIATNGLILFSVNTAFLMELMKQLKSAQNNITS